MVNKTITVIIPHYNYTEWLPDAIESAINQTVECQVAVVDDCSDNQDEVRAIVGEYVKKTNKRVRGTYLSENGGPSRARNKAIEYHPSDFYMNLDADDMMMPNKVEKFLEAFEHPEVGVVYGDYKIISGGLSKYEFKKPYEKLWLNQECIIHSGAMFRHEAIKSYIPEVYDPAMRTCEDYDLWIRISQNWMCYHVPEALTVVRDHPNNSSRTVAKEVWNENYNRMRMKYAAS